MADFNFPPRGSGSGLSASSATLAALPGDTVELQKRTLLTIEAILLLLSEAYEVPGGPEAYRTAVEPIAS